MVFLYSSTIWSQEEIISFQGFESNGDTWGPFNHSTPPCSSDDDHWDVVQNLGLILPSQGERFWGIQDLNGDCGSAQFEWIEFPTIDISSYQEVRCSFDYQVIGYDSGDDIFYELWFDDVPQQRINIVDGSSNFSTPGWVSAHIEIPNSVSTVRLRIYIKQNGSDQAGIDNVVLQGIPVAPCSDLFISEYVEGGSSVNHRNNYIEIFNSSPEEINLDDYELVKYTGKNQEASSLLTLDGIIPPLSTFLIEDDQEQLNVNADLSTNSAVMNYNGDDKIGLVYKGVLIDIVGKLGDSLDFGKDLVLRRKSFIQSPNSQFNPNEWDEYGFESIGNLNLHQSICQGPLPEIALLGNGLEIRDGNEQSQTLDNTYFGYLENGSGQSISHNYVIKNIGNALLQIEDIKIDGIHQGDFSLSSFGGLTISEGDSIVLQISFQPRANGVRNAFLSIKNNDPSESDYTVLIQGEGSHYSSSPVMITTYYEGDGNNRWIEITNISQENIEDSSYFLALYKQDLLHAPLHYKPSAKKAIPSMNAGQSLKFRASLNVTQPAYALDGSDIASGICGFNGDDVIIVSRSDDEKAWEDRIDMVGRTGHWGTDLAYLRKYGCNQENPHTGFDTDHWLPFTPDEINIAPMGNNARLGEYFVGQTTFEGSEWSNGIPDLNRSARILGDYKSLQEGNLKACNLIIDENAIVIIDKTNHLAVLNDLEVRGSLELMNGSDLLMINNSGKVINTGTIKVHKSSMPVSAFDYTYWTSPVNSSELGEVFHEANPNYMYTYSTALFEDHNEDGVNDNNNVWTPAFGTMIPAKGYAIMAPESVISGDRLQLFFEGDVNNGIVELPINLQGQVNSLNDWNLIGNPYPSALDAELLITNQNNSGLLGGTLYFWTHNTPLSLDTQSGEYEYASDDYAMYTIGTGGIRANSGGVTPDNYIASGQGFFVEALKAGSLHFDNSMRSVVEEQNFFKTDNSKSVEGDKLWLNLKGENGGFSQILIGFTEGATDAFDNLYDGVRFSANAHFEFYSVMNSLQLAIRGEGPFQSDKQIPLGYQLKSIDPGFLTIEIDKMTGVIEREAVILVDHRLGLKHDLVKEPYSFQPVETGLVNERFSLIFEQPLMVENVIPEDYKIIWTFENDDLLVRTPMNHIIHSLDIYDLLGRSVASARVSDSSVRLSLAHVAVNAPYLLVITIENNQTLATKILDLRP